MGVASRQTRISRRCGAFVENAAQHEEPPVATPCANMTKTAPFRPAVVKLKIPRTRIQGG